MISGFSQNLAWDVPDLISSDSEEEQKIDVKDIKVENVSVDDLEVAALQDLVKYEKNTIPRDSTTPFKDDAVQKQQTADNLVVNLFD